MWSKEITEEERKFGFEWIETQDPHSRTIYKPSKRKLVGKTLPGNITIFKEENEVYRFFRLDKLEVGDRTIPRWNSVLRGPVKGFPVLKTFLEKFNPEDLKEIWDLLKEEDLKKLGRRGRSKEQPK